MDTDIWSIAMTKQFLSPSAVFPSTVYTVIMVITSALQTKI